jgi:transposase InsO family protein
MFPNRIEGMKISDINQVWVSDICYLYGTNGVLLGYATSLIDLYSRKLLGLCFSQTMHASVTSQEVLRQALKEQNNNNLQNLIFHSDGGKQYIERDFVQALRAKNIQSSMAESCYQNAFAEAFNDILKNHILYDLNLNSFAQLKKQETFIKYAYNHNRPHNSINRLTPVEFEQHILTLQNCQRTTLEIKVIEHANLR